MHRLPKHELIRVFEGFAGYGGASMGRRTKRFFNGEGTNGGSSLFIGSYG